MSKIQETLMIVDLTRGHWKPIKQDKKLRREVAAWKDTTEDALRVGKHLWPPKKTPEVYSALTTAMTHAYDTHNELTAPWNGDGGRILKCAFHFDYASKMRDRRRECEAAWSAFKAKFPELKQWSREILPNIFSEADWPDERKLEKTFKFKIEFFPFPSTAEWIVEVSELEMQSLRQQAEASVHERLQEAMKEPYRRLFEAIKHMVDRLNSDSDNIHESVVTNIKKQCALVPALNLVDDERLNDLKDEIEAGLTRFTGDQLSAKGHLRKTVAARAEEIVEELEGMGVAA